MEEEIKLSDISIGGQPVAEPEQVEEQLEQEVEQQVEPQTEEVVQEETSEELPQSEESTEPVAEEEYDDERYFSDLSQATGVELSSDEDIVNALSELSQLRKKATEDPLDQLDPEIRDIVKAHNAGMDVGAFIRAKSLNVESMEDKQALKEKWMMDNQTLVKSNPKHAEEKFEREYKSKYASLFKELDREDFDDEQSYQQALSDQKFYKDEMQEDIRSAKSALKKWQEENVTIKDTPTGLSDEQVAQMRQQYLSKVEALVSDIDGVDIEIGDKNFKFGFDDKQIGTIRKALENPLQAAVDYLGIDILGDSVDEEKLASAISVLQLMESDKLGTQLKEWVLENYAKETITAKEENPKPDTPIPTAPQSEDLGTQIAQAYAAKRRR